MTAVNGKPYTSELLTAAVHDSVKNLAPIMLTAMRDDRESKLRDRLPVVEKVRGPGRNSKPDTLNYRISNLVSPIDRHLPGCRRLQPRKLF